LVLDVAVSVGGEIVLALTEGSGFSSSWSDFSKSKRPEFFTVNTIFENEEVVWACVVSVACSTGE
jgi:hypothetical protein